MEDQVALAERGAVVEKCYLPVVKGDVTIDEVVEGIREIGPEQCVVSTDHGQRDNPSPASAYAEVVAALRDGGLSESEIETVTVTTPSRIVG
jgi:predicted metal-dependent TIM-barrel fold hydrolase